MSEREPGRLGHSADQAVDRIAERMQQQPVPFHLANEVEGYGFKVVDPENESDARTIGVFPDQHYVSITTPDVTVKIKNATISAAKDGISVEAGDGSAHALFLKDGHIAVEVFPAPSLALPESPLTGETPPFYPNRHPKPFLGRLMTRKRHRKVRVNLPIITKGKRSNRASSSPVVSVLIPTTKHRRKAV